MGKWYTKTNYMSGAEGCQRGFLHWDHLPVGGVCVTVLRRMLSQTTGGDRDQNDLRRGTADLQVRDLLERALIGTDAAAPQSPRFD